MASPPPPDSSSADPSPPSPKPAVTSAGTLLTLAALGAASCIWALFLWKELIASRAGEQPFCAFGGHACGALWDSRFAHSVHELTGVPVAGWGLVWGLVALVLPWLCWLRQTTRPERGPQGVLVAAVEATAWGGLLGLGALLAVSAAAGLFCTSCAVTYVLTLAYAGIVFFRLRSPDGPAFWKGAGVALGAVAVAYLLLLYPGLETPASAADASRQALEEAADAARSGDALAQFLSSLEPRSLQAVSDSMEYYRTSSVVHQEEPRHLLGSPAAPVRITDFTDALCSHCADLHDTLGQLRELAPEGSFAIDSRHFPLDRTCNEHMPPHTEGAGISLHCLAAKAQICMEGTEHAFEFSGKIFENRLQLTPELIYQLAAPYVDRPTLEACVDSEETAAKLAADVAYAWHFRPRGTPLVLINGRQGTPFGPFLYAMVLAEGNGDHPAFAKLPPPTGF